MTDRIKELVQLQLAVPPGEDSPLILELCDFIRRGKGDQVLDSIAVPLKSTRPDVVLAAVGMMHQCVANSGPEFAGLLSAEKTMDRLFKLASDTSSQEVRDAVVSRVIRWGRIYATPGLQRCQERMAQSTTLGPIFCMFAESDKRSTTRRHADPTANSQTRPSNDAIQTGRPAAAAATSSSRPTASASSSPSTARRGNTRALSNLEAFILEAQGDLASLEYALEHPDMMDDNNVADCKRNRNKASVLLSQHQDMREEFRLPIVSLVEQLTVVLNLHAAIFGGEPVVDGDGGMEQRQRTDELAATLRESRSQHDHEGDVAVATANAIQHERQAIDELIEQERKEARDLRKQLEDLQQAKDEMHSKYKEAKEKNKQLITLVGEYGTKIDELESQKEQSNQVVAATEAKAQALANQQPKTVTVKPKVQRAVIKGIEQQIQAVRRGLRDVKDHSLRELGKELSLQSVQIQGAMAKILESADKDRKGEQKAMVRLQDLYKKEVKLRKQYYNTIQELKGNIRVYCRVRPMSKKEMQGGHTCAVDCGEEDELKITDEKGTKSYEFDAVFGQDTTQEKVFEDTSPLIDSVVDGYNVCIFAYGQTGSGKTHTMNGGTDAEMGINKRALERLFNIIAEREDTEESSVFVSVLEVYCEQIRDLLVSKAVAAKTSYDVKTGGPYGNYVSNLKETQVSNPADIESVINQAMSNRSEGQTDMNSHSSRSHMVMYILIKTRNKHTGAQTYGKLSLVDLAGSERLEKSKVEGQGAKEAIAINKSLSALGDVISGLSTSNKHIPFRNSQLTFLLQDSMSGQAKVLMFCCVSPASYNVNESNSSLMFASRARGVSLGTVKKNPQT